MRLVLLSLSFVACTEPPVAKQMLADTPARAPTSSSSASAPSEVAASQPVPAMPTPSTDRDTIAQVIRKQRNAFKYCYEKELAATPTLEGTVMVHFTLTAKGAVTNLSTSSTFKAPVIADCIKSAFAKLAFPPPSSGQDTTITFPFAFAPAK